jgi:hypothetical protein
MRREAKYIWMDQNREEDISKEMKTEPTLDKISKYKTNRTQDAHRTQRNRLSELLKEITSRMEQGTGEAV